MEEDKAAWFAGYTPNLATVVAVMGQNSNTGKQEPLYGATGLARVNGGGYPTQIWAAYTSGALKGIPSQGFDLQLEKGATAPPTSAPPTTTAPSTTAPATSAPPVTSAPPTTEVPTTTAPPTTLFPSGGMTGGTLGGTGGTDSTGGTGGGATTDGLDFGGTTEGVENTFQ
jgi:membrane peptidoglycan carboxypeptidase